MRRVRVSSSAACSEMARPTWPPKSWPRRAISGTRPLVETVTRRDERRDALGVREEAQRAGGGLVVVRAARPCPCRRRCVRRSPSSRRARPVRTWATISSAPRWRFRPATPLAQKTQPMAQPTWVEMHWVTRMAGAAPLVPLASAGASSSGSSSSPSSIAAKPGTGDGKRPFGPVTPGMRTVSTVAPSRMRTRSLRVSSAARRSSDTDRVLSISRGASFSRKLAGRSVILLASKTLRPCTQRKICRAWNALPPPPRVLSASTHSSGVRASGATAGPVTGAGRPSGLGPWLLPSTRRGPRAAGASRRRPPALPPRPSRRAAPSRASRRGRSAG